MIDVIIRLALANAVIGILLFEIVGWWGTRNLRLPISEEEKKRWPN